ncbi:DNA polymerase III subunit chi [Paramagnetospirillum kuznetsovii]|uniref:DNA polymerase III subunit chi n=1 Tax=Paramagnetospirillum kuznetsovii TaxID=2053833 RepID=A0A364P125_9PROT|nr:DNA polymerase III subunit chi [Paramagnetospirillum kuznetsovii]RAU23013.1 DNA polymerase III subunit chi [Paramagnetospirillum kuznetsovii]
MTQIGFYHLTRLSLDQALPKLLDKALAAGHRAVVLAGSAERVDDLNERLWTFEPESWIPHGAARDGDPALQPIWLTDRDENPNEATILVMCDGARSEAVEGFARCLDLFDGNDPDAVQAARERWKDWKAAGHELVYYQQTERGGWEEKARG